MKQKISLTSSISILIGVVIAILALLRGPAQTVLMLLTFTLWGLWVVLTLLRPAWRANRAYRCQEERAAREQGEFAGRNLAALLLRHVNCRVSEALKSVYPDVSWEWTMDDPAIFVVRGGTGRIQVYGVPDYEFADVTIDQSGNLKCAMVKVAPLGGAAPAQSSLDPQAWFELEGRQLLDTVVADLKTRGHHKLTVNEDGSICIRPKSGKNVIKKGAFSNFPDKVYWPRLADVLNQEGLTADVQADHIAVSW